MIRWRIGPEEGARGTVQCMSPVYQHCISVIRA
jgi:hypothetical protein